MKNKKKLTLLLEKAIIYRIFSFIISTFVLFILIGDIKKVGLMTLILELIKTVQYFSFDYIFALYLKCKK